MKNTRDGKASSVGKNKTSNRWLILIAGTSILFCLGGGLYSWSVFIIPLENDFSWTRAEVVVAFSLAVLVINAAMFIPGRILDVWGPRITGTATAIFCFAGYFLASRLDSLWELYLGYGILAGLAGSFGYVSVVSTILKWFPDKRGLASGLVLSGLGSGAFFFSPIIVALMGPEGNWSKAFFTLAIAFMLVILVSAQLLRNPPKDWTPTVREKLQPSVKPNPSIKEFTWRETIRTSAFWRLFITFCFGGMPGFLFVSHLAAFGQELGYTIAQAMLAVSIFAVGNAVGRPMWGAIADRIGIEHTLFTMYGTQGLLYIAIAVKDIGMLGLLFPLFITLSLVGGGCFGGNFPLSGAINANYFGTKNLGMNYGLQTIGNGLGGAFGPVLGGWVFGATGGYFWAFITAAVISFMVAGVAFTTRSPRVE